MNRTIRFITVTAAAMAVLTLVPAPAGAQTDLAQARAATARYHDPAVAIAEGFVPEEECSADEAGGMGVHWGNFARFDTRVDPREPEVLLYEPGTRDRLVGLEYVAAAPVGSPPTLFGQTFQQGPEIGDGLAIYALHVWLWRDNPAGMFAPWNTRVTCPS